MNIKSLAALALGAYVSVIAFAGESNNASAAIRRMNGIACHLKNTTNQSFVEYSGALLYSSSATSNGAFYCPFESDSTLLHSSIAQLNVYGSNTSTQALTRACIHEASAPTSSCGVARYWSNALGLVASGVDTSVWRDTNNVNDYAYIYNTLAPGNSLHGFWMSS